MIRHKIAFVVKAWNAYQDGVTIQKLQWQAGGAHPEPFPAIRGLGTETQAA